VRSSARMLSPPPDREPPGHPSGHVDPSRVRPQRRRLIDRRGGAGTTHTAAAAGTRPAPPRGPPGDQSRHRQALVAPLRAITLGAKRLPSRRASPHHHVLAPSTGVGIPTRPMDHDASRGFQALRRVAPGPRWSGATPRIELGHLSVGVFDPVLRPSRGPAAAAS
jgi:hypothetical protein